jgi:hypothetical protein
MIDPTKYGVSFSAKQCEKFGLDPHETLDWLLAQGWRRFRLMSYWSTHEPQPGHYDFSELDWQLEKVAAAGGVVSLALGTKQPRWPEYHWPTWAWQADKPTRDSALLAYVERVVERYKTHPEIVSWQLENEALLRGFGSRIEIDRQRLRAEFALAKRLDPTRPVAMSTSNGWGVPLRAPHADMVGFSYYLVVHSHGRYHSTVQQPWLHKLRKYFIQSVLRTPVFIHELQCEPWGPQDIWNMTTQEQDAGMGPEQLAKNLAAAKSIGLYPIDLWGSEWWYWRHVRGDSSVWRAVRAALDSSGH